MGRKYPSPPPQKVNNNETKIGGRIEKKIIKQRNKTWIVTFKFQIQKNYHIKTSRKKKKDKNNRRNEESVKRKSSFPAPPFPPDAAVRFQPPMTRHSCQTWAPSAIISPSVPLLAAKPRIRRHSILVLVWWWWWWRRQDGPLSPQSTTRTQT